MAEHIEEHWAKPGGGGGKDRGEKEGKGQEGRAGDRASGGASGRPGSKVGSPTEQVHCTVKNNCLLCYAGSDNSHAADA